MTRRIIKVGKQREALVKKTRGMLKGGPSLSRALKRLRQRDIQRDSKT